MRKYLFLTILTALLSSCGQEEIAILAPEIIMSPSLAAEINQVDFWIYDIVDTNGDPLSCKRLTVSGNDAIRTDDDSLKIVYQNSLVFYQDREVKKEFHNIPAASNYFIYARGFKVGRDVHNNINKTLQAHGCVSNIAIKSDEVTAVTIVLSAASAN